MKKRRTLKKNYLLKRKKKNSHIYFIISIVLLLVLFIYLFSYFYGFSFLFEFFDEPKKFEIADECSLIVGRLIHQIRDESDCKLQCKNICEVNELEFDSFEFIPSENSCHSCNCYCD